MSAAQLEEVIRSVQACFGAWTPTTSLAQMRQDWDEVFGQSSSGVGITATPTELGGVPALRLAAPGTTASRVVLYLHGGGFVFGSPRSHRDLGDFLSQAAGATVYLLDYRLAPEHPFPAAVDDATAAYRALLAAGTPATGIAVCGDSAGGGLTFSTLLSIRDQGLPPPACAIALSPWVDLACTGETFATNAAIDPMVQRDFTFQLAGLYCTQEQLRHPLASPLNGNLNGLPPMLVQVGERETLLDDSRRIVARARAAGVDIQLEIEPGQIHVYQIFAARLDEGAAAIERIGRFIRRHIPG